MAANDYKPVSWNGEPITNAKLNQMTQNTQYIFERQPKLRYSANNLVRESGLKVINGKTYFAAVNGSNYTYVGVYFGSFFTAGCKPVVTATVEANNDAYTHRSHVTIQGFNGEVDHVGFTGIIANEPYTRQGSGWVHWTAVGY